MGECRLGGGVMSHWNSCACQDRLRTDPVGNLVDAARRLPRASLPQAAFLYRAAVTRDVYHRADADAAVPPRAQRSDGDARPGRTPCATMPLIPRRIGFANSHGPSSQRTDLVPPVRRAGIGALDGAADRPAGVVVQSRSARAERRLRRVSVADPGS
ncbi:hypothetical protein [Lysobacter gummosus]|uniref:hypothetical protein n=1 Tax=Lysobacter gummosus TaxID=262324 RepID=UPI003644BADC